MTRTAFFIDKKGHLITNFMLFQTAMIENSAWTRN